MMPSGIAMGILNPVAGKMYDRIGGRPLALLGFAIMTSAAVLLVTIMNTHTAAAMRTGVPEAAASVWKQSAVAQKKQYLLKTARKQRHVSRKTSVLPNLHPAVI